MFTAARSRRVLLAVATLAVALPAVSASAAVTIASKFVGINGGLNARTASFSYNAPRVYSLVGTTTDPVAVPVVSDSRAGSILNNAGGTVANGTTAAMSTFALDYVGGSLSSFSTTGSYSSTTTLVSLANYTPPNAPAGVALGINNNGGYNASLQFTVNAPTPVTFSLSQSNASGAVGNSGNIIFRYSDGVTPDLIIFNTSLGGNNSFTQSAVLQPLANGSYYCSFFGNTSDFLTVPGTASSSASYAASLTFAPAIPEPGMLAAVLPAVALVARRRR